MCSTVDFFGIKIPSYSLLTFLGAAAAIAFCLLQCRFPRRADGDKPNCHDMFFMLVFAAAGAFIGARIMFVITSENLVWDSEVDFWVNIIEWAKQISTGGLVFYGGLTGGAAAAALYARRWGMPVSEAVDIMFAGVPLFHAFGRAGCFLSGCCYGTEYHGPFAVTFPKGNAGMAPYGVELFPVQLAEAALNIVLWAAVFAVYRKSSHKWITTGVYLVSYSVMRFVLEFFRGDDIRGYVGGLSSSQLFGIFAAAVGVVMLVKSGMRRQEN